MESITTPHLNEITATKKRNRPGQKQRAKEKKKLRLDKLVPRMLLIFNKSGHTALVL